MLRGGFFALLGVLLIAGPAWAATPSAKCSAGKLKVAGAYTACRMKADAKALKKGELPDYTKCDQKFAGKWQKEEAKAGGECWTQGDQVDVQSELTTAADNLARDLTLCGDAAAPVCKGTCPFNDPCVSQGDACVCF